MAAECTEIFLVHLVDRPYSLYEKLSVNLQFITREVNDLRKVAMTLTTVLTVGAVVFMLKNKKKKINYEIVESQ